jgi:hypothetical protein
MAPVTSAIELSTLLGLDWAPNAGRTGPQIMPSGLNTDTSRALASLANLDGIKAGMLLPGHGDPWTGGVQDAIRRARAAGPS